MSGPPQGPGASRAMSVGNGPPSAGLPPQHSMPPQQNAVPPPAAGSAGPQSQQNLNQIVSAAISSLSPHRSLLFFTTCHLSRDVRDVITIALWTTRPPALPL